MDLVSISVICLVGGLIITVVVQAKRNDELATIPEFRLLEECYWEAQCGKHKCAYTRELARRKKSMQPKFNSESVPVDQL